MTKKEIVKKISEDIGLTQLKTKDIVQRTLDAIIQTLVQGAGWGVVPAKMASELLVYAANFLIQRDIVFSDALKDGQSPAAQTEERTAAAA